MTYIEVTPAYGRDYRTAKAAKADWKADKDFRETVTGSYINETDARREDLKVIIRFDQNRKTTATS